MGEKHLKKQIGKRRINYLSWINSLKKIAKRHQYSTLAGTAFIYAILVSIAMNFLTPGKIYASGITGFAQLVSTLVVVIYHLTYQPP